MREAKPEVIVYTTPFCAPCEGLKRYLIARGISFRQRDLLMEEAAGQHLEAHEIYASPALEVDGEFFVGDALAPDRLDALFAD